MQFSSICVQIYILCLANSSLNCFVTASDETRWPYNLPPHVKYFPEDEVLVKRNMEMVERIQQQQPTVVRKMSSDPGEMFFLHYWSLNEDGKDDHLVKSLDNTTISTGPFPPTPLHAVAQPPVSPMLRRFFHMAAPAINIFDKRDFTCPAGTNACASINRPNVCCPSSSTCQIVPTSGLGDVGCCDATSACAGSLSQCPNGYSSCPIGGGCCLPGYACFQEGCVQTSTTVVLISPTASSSTSAPTLSTITDTVTVIITPSVASMPPTTVTRTETLTIIPSTVTPSTSATSVNTLICSSGFRSCPASLGGGCCPTDRACGQVTCPALTSSATLVPPVRGTSSSPSITGIVSGCPNGFYACSAYYPGACCQIGRDCHSTSCPANSAITIVNTGSVTVVGPPGLSFSQTIPSGACATGWATCETDVGGGCCPSGFACGIAACTATISGISGTQAKIAPSGAVHLIVVSRWVLTIWTALTMGFTFLFTV